MLSNSGFPRVEAATVSIQSGGQTIFVSTHGPGRMCSGPGPPGTLGRHHFRTPPGWASCVDEGWKMIPRTILESGIVATFPKRHNCLAISWSASGRAEAMSETLSLDTLEIVGCGIPQFFRKQQTCKEWIREYSASLIANCPSKACFLSIQPYLKLCGLIAVHFSLND